MEFFQENIHLKEVFVQLAAFAIVFWVLRRFAWKPILQVLDERRQRIAQGQREIEDAKKALEISKQDYEKRVSRIEEEARAKLQAAIDEGRQIAREIQEKAREDTKQALTRTKEDLTLEVAKARIELRREIAELTLLATEKLLREKMTDEKHREKILEMIEELEAK